MLLKVIQGPGPGHQHQLALVGADAATTCNFHNGHTCEPCPCPCATASCIVHFKDVSCGMCIIIPIESKGRGNAPKSNLKSQ